MRALASMGDASWDRSTWLDGYVPIEDYPRRVRPVTSARSTDDRPVSDGHLGIAESDEWAMAIGRSIIAFGRIEYSVTLLIRQCTPDAVGYRAARLDLPARLAYVDKLLRAFGLTKEEKRNWRHVHRRIDGLRAKYRTILAYGASLPGPIEFTGDLVIVRVSHTGPRRREGLLTLPQIELAAEHITGVHAEFVQTTTEILTRLVAQGRLPLPTAAAMPKRAQTKARPNHQEKGFLLPLAWAPAPLSRGRSGQLVGNGGA
jgi:hypothetical protein